MKARVIRLVRRPGCQLVVYPNCVYLVEDGQELAVFTTEQWAEMVAAVGIRFMDAVDAR